MHSIRDVNMVNQTAWNVKINEFVVDWESRLWDRRRGRGERHRWGRGLLYAPLFISGGAASCGGAEKSGTAHENPPWRSLTREIRPKPSD